MMFSEMLIRHDDIPVRLSYSNNYYNNSCTRTCYLLIIIITFSGTVTLHSSIVANVTTGEPSN